MNGINKCLKDWNATTEALGQGKQTILIRNYSTRVKEFLLYPTVSYALKNDYLDSFQTKYQSFVEENTYPENKGDDVLIKYFATLEKMIERPASRIPSDKYYIWTRDHVKNFVSGRTIFVWILRVYSLKNPFWAEPTTGAIRFANLNEEVPLKGIKPVLSDSKFSKILGEIK